MILRIEQPRQILAPMVVLDSVGIDRCFDNSELCVRFRFFPERQTQLTSLVSARRLDGRTQAVGMESGYHRPCLRLSIPRHSRMGRSRVLPRLHQSHPHHHVHPRWVDL